MINKALSLSQALARVTDKIESSMAPPVTTVFEPTPIDDELSQIQGAMNQDLEVARSYQSDANDRWNEDGLLSYSNLNSNNPLVSVPTNLLNWGTMATGQAANMLLNAGANQVRDVAMESNPDPTQRGGGFNAMSLLPVVGPIMNLETKAFGALVRSAEERDVEQGKSQVGDFGRKLHSVADVLGGNEKSGQHNILNTEEWANHYARDNFQNTKQEMGVDDNVNKLWDQTTQSWRDGDTTGAIGKALSTVKEGLSGNLSAAFQNPAFITDTFAETLPYLLGRGIGTTMIGADHLRVRQQGISNFVSREGRNPTAAELLKIDAAASAYTALNFAEVSTLKGALKGTLPAVGGTGRIGAALGAVTNKVPGFIGNAAKAGVTEGIAEGFQTQIENDWANLSTDVDAASVLEGAGLGMALGGTLSVPGSIRQSAVNVLQKQIDKQQAAVEQEVGKASVSTEQMLDKASSDYAPAKAITRMVNEVMKNPDTADVDAVRSTMDSVKSELSSTQSFHEKVIQGIKDPAFAESEYARLIKQADDKLQPFIGTPNEEAARNTLEGLKQVQTNIIEAVRAHANDTNPDAYLAKQESLRDQAATDLDVVNQRSSQLSEFIKSRPVPPVENNEGDVTDNSQTTPKTTMGYPEFMRSPANFSDEDVQALLDSQDLDDATKNNIRVVSDVVREATKLKDMDMVSNDVVHGGKGFMGINQYLSSMGEAVVQQDSVRQDNLQRQIGRFQVDHANKLDAAQRAMDIANETGAKTQIVKVANSNDWKVLSGRDRVSKSVLEKNQGVILNPVMESQGKVGSTGFVDELASEVKLINSAVSAMNKLAQPVPTFEQAMDNALSSLPTQSNTQEAPITPTIPEQAPIAQTTQSTGIEDILDLPSLDTMETVFNEDGVGSLRPKQPKINSFTVNGVDQAIQDGVSNVTVQDANGQEVPFKNFALSVEGNTAEIGMVERERSSNPDHKGAGIEAYKQIGQQLADQGITLTSSQSLKADGMKLWQSLVKQGLAIKDGSTYKFKMPEQARPETSNGVTQDTAESAMEVINVNLGTDLSVDTMPTEYVSMLDKKNAKALSNQEISKREHAENTAAISLLKKYYGIPAVKTEVNTNPDNTAAPNAADLAIDEINRVERNSGRDMSARNTDPKVKNVSKVQEDKVREQVTQAQKYGNRFEGWKLHLNFDSNNAEHRKKIESVLSSLKDRGMLVSFKLGKNAGQEGKEATVYVGHKDSAKFIANMLERKLDAELIDAGKDAKTDDAQFTKRVWGRFDVQSTKQKGMKGPDGKRIWGMGENGIPRSQELISAMRFSDDPKLIQQLVDLDAAALNNTYRDYFSGSNETKSTINPIVDKPADKSVDKSTKPKEDKAGQTTKRNDSEAAVVKAQPDIDFDALTETDFKSQQDYDNYLDTGSWILSESDREAIIARRAGKVVDTPKPEPVTGPTAVEPSDDQTLVDNDELEALVDETIDPDAVSVKGAITPIDGKDPASIKEERAKTYNEQNLVSSGFTQVIMDGLNSPLVLGKDFVNRLFKTKNFEAIIKQYTGKEATENQLAAMHQYTKFHAQVASVIKSIVVPHPNRFFDHEKFNQFLISDHGDGVRSLDDNTVAAVSAIMFSWLSESSTRVYATSSEIGTKLGMSDVNSVPADIFNILSPAGAHRPTLTAELGERVYQALQLKLLKGVDPLRKNKLEMALGSLVIASMIKTGFAEPTEISDEQMKDFSKRIIDSNPGASTSRELGTEPDGYKNTVFIRPKLAQDADGYSLSARITDLIGAAKGSSSVISKIFSFTPMVKLPSLEPVTTTPQTYNNQGSVVPDLVKKVMLKQQAAPYQINIGMAKLLDTLATKGNSEAIYKLFGYKDEAALNGMHEFFKVSQRAVNDSVIRSFDIYNQTVEMLSNPDTDELSPFYLAQTMHRNNRSGYLSDFNLQENKVHRALASLVSDKQTVTIPVNMLATSTADFFISKRKLTSYGNFLRALAFRMEPGDLSFDNKVKTGTTVDKASLQTFIPALHAYIQSPAVQQAIDALLDIRAGNVKDENLATVQATVDNWGMSGLSLSALNTLADMKQAMLNGDTSFDSYLPGASDGVSNGAVITGIMLDILGILERMNGGVYPKAGKGEIQHTNVPEYRENTRGDGLAKDAYEVVGRVISLLWANEVQDTSPRGKVVAALNVLNPKFASRSGAKAIVIPVNYGSAVTSAIRSAGVAALTSTYQKIQDAIDNNDLDTIGVIVDHMNNIISHGAYTIAARAAKGKPAPGSYSVTRINKPADIEAAKKLLLDTKQELQFLASVSAVQGNAIKSALEEVYAGYFNKRDRKTSIANVAYNIYEILYKASKQSRMETALANNEIPMLKDKPAEGLSNSQLTDLANAMRPFMPIAATAVGVASKQAVQAGIPLMKSTTRWNISPLYQQQNTFSNVRYTTTPESSKGQKAHEGNMSISTGIREKVTAAPGVSGMALYIQSIDSYITYMTMLKHGVQNYHDANEGNTEELNDIARTQNEAFVDGLSMSHIGMAFYTAFIKPVLGLQKMGENLTTDDRAVIADMFDGMAAKHGLQGFKNHTELLNGLIEAHFNPDISKMEKLVNEEYINQYGTQGGEFQMTDEKRAEIRKRTAALKSAKKRAIEQASNLGKFLDGYLPIKAIEQTSTPEAVKLSVDFNSVITALPAASTVSTLLNTLDSYLGRDGQSDVSAQQKKNFTLLMDLVRKTIPADTEVNVFTPGNIPAEVRIPDDHDGRAWFSVPKNKEQNPQINLMTYIRNEPITPEVAMHELIHAVTATTVEAYRANPSAYPELKESMDILDTVEQALRNKYANDTDRMVQYTLSNSHEMIAMGLTDPTAIRMMLDTKVTVKLGEVSRITTALYAAAKGLMGLFKVDRNPSRATVKEVTAYEALLVATADIAGNQRRADIAPKSLRYPGQSKQQAKNIVSQYTAKEVFDALQDTSISSEFRTHLSGLMTNLTDKLMATTTRLYATSVNKLSAADLWQEALSSGKAPYSTDALAAGFNLSNQEQFAVEALESTLSAAIKEKSLTKVFKEMQSVYDLARTSLKPQSFYAGNWATASQQDKDAAQRKYDYLFNDNYRTDKLVRFSSLALGHESLNKLLDINIPKYRAKADASLFEKLVHLANQVISYAFGYLTNTTYVTNARNKLPLLAQHLIQVEIKNRDKATNVIESAINAAEEYSDSATESVRNAVTKLLDNSFMATSQNKYVSLAYNTTRASINGRAMSLLDVIKDYRDQFNQGSILGTRGELLNEIKNGSISRNIAQRLLRHTKDNEKLAQGLRTAAKQLSLQMFDELGNNLTREDKIAISYVGLRTDMQSLLGKYTHAEILGLLKNKSKLDSEIAAVAKQINDPVIKTQAMILGNYMVSGKGNNNLAKNAALIAIQNTGGADVDLVGQIGTIASLYALSYSDAQHRINFIAVMEKELARGKENGFTGLMNLHASLISDSLDINFKDNPLSMAKGWLPEIVNGHRDIKVAYTQAELNNLKNAFYKPITTMKPDPLDPTGNVTTLMYAEDAGNQRIVSGAIALRHTERKGSGIDMTAAQLKDAKARSYADLMRKASDPSYDPRQDTSRAIPSYDLNGNITGYNYEMEGRNRDEYLQRNNDFSDLIGQFGYLGLVQMRESGQNLDVVDALREDWHSNSRKYPNAYLRIAPDSKDPKLQQAWAMIPKETRDYIKETWGGNFMYVHNEAFLPIFGFRKMSLSNIFKNNERGDYMTVANTVAVAVLRTIFGDSAAMRTAQLERIWQEVVGKTKSFIVIRNVSTMIGNIIANTILLTAHGVPVSAMVKDYVKSVKAGMQHRKDTAMMVRLQLEQVTYPDRAQQLQHQIDKLAYSLEQNPLKDFINEGMLAGIVEDVDVEQDIYSYASGFQRKVESITDAIPEIIKDAARYAMVSPGTPHYSFLHSATQFSDFAAKYVLYNHARTRSKDQLNHEDALQLAEDNFINYDMHTSPALQYLNDMGMVMFTKYTLRIQRALFQLIAKRPASVLFHSMLTTALSSMPDAVDPLVFNQIHSPFRNGAFGIADTWDEPFPIQVIKGLF